MAPLNRLVLEMRGDAGLANDAKSISYVDPDSGGTSARVLFLLRDPSRVAAEGTGFISPDNPDSTADNFTWLREQAHLDRNLCLHWNVVPWFIGKRNAAAEARRARPWLERFIAEMTNLKVVVCLGDDARKAWDAIHPTNPCREGWQPISQAMRGPLVLWCPHTSFHNVDGGHAKRERDGLTPKERILKTFDQVRARLETSG